MFRPVRYTAIALVFAAFALPVRPATKPSRPAQKGCKWERFSDADLGLAAWVQRCDYGFRKIDFLKVPGALAVRFSDGEGEPDRVIEVLDLQPGEAPEAGLRRLFAARTDRQVAKRCTLAPYREGNGPAGVARYGFVPDTKYAKELAAKNDPNEVPDPPCGDWGDVVDGIQYWETHPKSGAQRVLFVRAGQDEPQFDEQTLEILPPKK
ncbi:MAG TPA: hypothetical protein VGS22_23135 [Thermoanaerobaculia bacterium]|jgi:hypothetical protein|nr:hypothetical protein [Thermoanaerobaculia bacterium]